MPPWFNSVALNTEPGKAPFFAVDWASLPAFVLPIYGKSLPRRGSAASFVAWVALLCAWLPLALRGLRSCFPSARPAAKGARSPVVMLARWLADPGPYRSLDLSVSLYLLLITAGVFLSGLYAPADMNFNNESSLFGALGSGPETLDRLGLRWFCAAAAAAASLLLARAASLSGCAREAVRGHALLCLLGCVWVHACIRIRAVTVVRDPHKSILGADWSLLAIVVALSARSLGADEWLCSCWLRKFMFTTLGLMYLNAGLSKVHNTGAAWYDGDRIRQLIRDARWTSAWPWASDTVMESPFIGRLLGMGTLFFEVPLSLVVIIGFPCWGCLGGPRGLGGAWLSAVRNLWLVLALGFHFSIYVLCYPSFATFVHALLALVMDPMAHLPQVPTQNGELPAPALDSHEHVDEKAPSSTLLARAEEKPEGGKKSSTLRLRKSFAAPSFLHKAELKVHWAEEASDDEHPIPEGDRREPADTLRGPSVCAFSGLLCLCVVGWVYVGIVFSDRDHHSLLPFSSMQMFSTYPAQRSQQGQLSAGSYNVPPKPVPRVPVEFVNSRRQSMELWFQAGPQRNKLATLQTGQRRVVNCVIGHTVQWVEAATGTVVERVTVSHGLGQSSV